MLTRTDVNDRPPLFLVGHPYLVPVHSSIET
jgi:hypothetical protein